MEVELPSIPLSIRPKYTQTFKTYKSQLDRTKKVLREAKQGQNRNELLSSGRDAGLSDDPYSDGPGGGEGDYGQRTRLLKGTERLQDGELLMLGEACDGRGADKLGSYRSTGTRRLEESHRLALETEDVGADILRNLRGQREQIEHSRDVVSPNSRPSHHPYTHLFKPTRGRLIFYLLISVRGVM